MATYYVDNNGSICSLGHWEKQSQKTRTQLPSVHPCVMLRVANYTQTSDWFHWDIQTCNIHTSWSLKTQHDCSVTTPDRVCYLLSILVPNKQHTFLFLSTLKQIIILRQDSSAESTVRGEGVSTYLLGLLDNACTLSFGLLYEEDQSVAHSSDVVSTIHKRTRNFGFLFFTSMCTTMPSFCSSTSTALFLLWLPAKVALLRPAVLRQTVLQDLGKGHLEDVSLGILITICDCKWLISQSKAFTLWNKTISEHWWWNLSLMLCLSDVGHHSDMIDSQRGQHQRIQEEMDQMQHKGDC